jgi:hypothetical protein
VKRALALALLLAAGCGKAEPPRGKVSAEIADQGPRLVGNPPTVQIELPPRMTQALAAGDSGYATLGPFDFVSSISPGDATDGAWRYSYNGREAPFAVIADFDGNGRDDVALLQRSPEGGRVVVVFDDSAPRVAIAKSWLRMTAGDTGKSGFYLSLFREGPYRVPDFGGAGVETTVTLAHEGIEVSNFGKTATTYYWTGERFESVTTGD